MNKMMFVTSFTPCLRAMVKYANKKLGTSNRHFSLLNVNFAGACGYDFVCDGRRLVRAYLRRRRGAI